MADILPLFIRIRIELLSSLTLTSHERIEATIYSGFQVRAIVQ
jgi:hypothetical protein